MEAFVRDAHRGGRFVGARRFVSMARAGRCAGALVMSLAVFASVSAARGATLVTMNFANFGAVQIDLFDDLVAATVDNFVDRYVATNRYSDSMIHRVDTGLGVIQGGGFNVLAQPIATDADPFMPLQYSRANTRGTIAMARQGDGGIAANTGTATSQWFINTDNNSTSLGPAPASGGIPQQFGYAVFGWVVGPGMSVVDNIYAVPTFAYGSPFGQVPLTDFDQADFLGGVDPLPHVVKLSSVTFATRTASYQNPFLATDVNNSGTMNATDAITVISDLVVNGPRTLTAPFAGTSYFDIDGNGKVGIPDALLAINAVLAAQGASAQSSAMAGAMTMSMPMIGVPEPSSLVLGGAAALVLSGCALARRQRNRRSRRTPA